jgi:L-2,4-diaminobutyrate decarboxylase
MKREGKYYLHQFPIKDDNDIISKNATVYPLRFMSGNPNITKDDLLNLVIYIRYVYTQVFSE